MVANKAHRIDFAVIDELMKQGKIPKQYDHVLELLDEEYRDMPGWENGDWVSLIPQNWDYEISMSSGLAEEKSYRSSYFWCNVLLWPAGRRGQITEREPYGNNIVFYSATSYTRKEAFRHATAGAALLVRTYLATIATKNEQP